MAKTPTITKILHVEVTGCHNCPAYRFITSCCEENYHSCNLDGDGWPPLTNSCFDTGMHESDGFARKCPLTTKVELITE